MKKKIILAVTLVTTVISIVIGFTLLICMVEGNRFHNPLEIISLSPFEKPVKIDLSFQPEYLCILGSRGKRMMIYADDDPQVKILKTKTNQFLDQQNYYGNESGEITLIFMGTQQIKALSLNHYASSRNIFMWPTNDPDNKLLLKYYFRCKALPFKYPETPQTPQYFSFYLMAKE